MYESSVSIKRHGNPSHGYFADTVNIASEPNPQACVAADFDGNGRIDLAVANSTSDEVSILLNQTLPVRGCLGTTGNFDCDWGEAVDISDLSVFADHLFVSFAQLCCDDEVECDGSPGIDIGDISALIDSLFFQHYAIEELSLALLESPRRGKDFKFHLSKGRT